MLLRSVRTAFNAVMTSLERRIVAQPFSDPRGRKGWWSWLSRAPTLSVRQVWIGMAGWPRTSRPLRLLFLSDLHVGSHTDDVDRLGMIMRSAGELQPDLMCLGGDYVNSLLFGGGRVPPETIAELLAVVKPPLGSFAILGDHDELYGASAIAGALQDAGLTVLRNQAADIAFDGQEITIVGVTPDAAELPKLIRKARAGHPTIVLAHDPAAFALLPRETSCLMLCGHTHGGQIRVPLLGPLVNMSDAPLAWTYGHVVEGECHLYVTSGLGVSLFPLRLGVPPEVVLIRVQGPQRESARV
jgi:predicted MPP superfamily phosphohydrolase